MIINRFNLNAAAKTLIFAHRGANREAPENCRSAFDRALAYPIDGIETDIQLSRDDVTVLWHDRFLSKLAGLEALHIDDFDYAALSQMNFAAHFSPSHPPEGILSLQAFLDAYRSRCRLLLEIKNRDWETPERQLSKVRQTLALVGENSPQQILVSSFNLLSLQQAHDYQADFPLVYNLEPEQTLAEAEQALADNPFLHGLCLPISSLNSSFVQMLRENGKSIAVYTCNRDEEIQRALGLGVDILISDLPQKALQMREVWVGNDLTI